MSNDQREVKMDGQSLPLHDCHVQLSRTVANRVHILIQSLAILALVYYRVSSLFSGNQVVSVFPWVLITASELLHSFLWALAQSYRWRPVSRNVYPDRLPADDKLPAIDVFICTADPEKEPTVEVMNTVISAMSLDYPPDKLSVYLSDDAGAPITLFAVEEAFAFARSWIPFRKSYGIKTGCPESYFSRSAYGEENHESNMKFNADREDIKLKYRVFKQRVEQAKGSMGGSSSQDRPPIIQVIGGDENEELDKGARMPLLVYISREKRRGQPHHFKAGALNVLIRVSSIISNSPYILVLDCDMYCNDPTSARQAMCFHLDPQMSQSLAFVQFPQEFYNMTNSDIYNGQLPTCFKILWPGMDGLKGPILSGTGFYLKREPLYKRSAKEDIDPPPSKNCFGPSNEFIATLDENQSSKVMYSEGEAKLLASCTYEKDTQWGEQIGFRYHSVVEDYFTGFNMHCKGWDSVYCYTSRPAFLGCVTTNLSDNLVQTARWNSGLLQVCLSRFCPLIYGSLRMSILQSMCYAYLAFQSFASLALTCHAILLTFSFFNDIPLYPKVSNPWFSIFAIVYISPQLHFLLEVLTTGGSFKNWWYDSRMSLIRSVTAYLFACLDFFMKWIGRNEIKFLPTNKIVVEEQVQRYNMDVFDFQAPIVFLLPLTTIINMNMASLAFGLRRVILNGTYDQMFGQIILSTFILIIGYPIFEGMFMRKDRGRIPTSVTVLSVTLVTVILSLGFVNYN